MPFTLAPLPLRRASFLKMTESHTEALHTGWLIRGISKVYFLGAFTYPPPRQKKKKNSDVFISEIGVSYGEGRV